MDNSTKKLKKIHLRPKTIEVLEKLTGLKIYTKNVWNIDKMELGNLLQQGRINALMYLQRYQQGQKLSIFEEQNLFKALVEIQQKLSLNQIPIHIECYDVSHFGGKYVYGSMVVFIEGRSVKKLYRLFKTAEKNDDFANLREVLLRRFKKWEENQHQPPTIKLNLSTKPILKKPWELPNLIIIDGGKGQLSSANQVLQEFKQKYSSITTQICALAKGKEEIFLLDKDESVLFEGQAKFLLQRIRDEAHRFGITNSRKAIVRQSSKSSLDSIKGIGKVTKNKLLTIFGSIENLINHYYFDPQTLQQILTKTQFKNLESWIRNGEI